MTTMRQVAPRLARAWESHLAEQAELERRRKKAINRLHHAERLVAHRELQLIRAVHTHDSKYIDRRQKKLDEAIANLDRLRRIAEG